MLRNFANMTWKHLWAWLLLLTVSIQWIGGVIYVKLTHSSLIEQAMDDSETVLAEKISLDYGIETQIKILDESEQLASLSAGYGAPFLFSVSDDEDADYFTLDESGLEMVHSEYLINGPEQQKDAGKALLSLHKLFSPYIINRAELLKPIEMYRISSGNFLYNPLKDLYHQSIPTPPPTFLG